MPSETKVYYPNPNFSKNAYINSFSQYREMYLQSLDNPEAFWGEIIKQFHWETPVEYDNFFRYNFDIRKGPIYTKWFDGATTNICYNVLDRIVQRGYGDKVAYYWEGNHPDDYSRLTYRKLLEEVCKFSNVLKSKGIKKGDRVAVYMPMILEAVITLLACTRIGAVHSVVFAGFSADSFAERVIDCGAEIIVTADGVWRGPKFLGLKSICDQVMDKCARRNHNIRHCIVVAHLKRVTSPDNSQKSNKVHMKEGRDIWWNDAVADSSITCPPVWTNSEDPLFMLYTSGSTGKPKGVLHTVGGYMVYTAATFKCVFDYKSKDVYWCTADIGWITGHSYGVYGPLANAATCVLFEGTPFYPDNDRFWTVIEKYKVNQFYTAPTAIRALMKYGDDLVRRHDVSSLKVIGSVGEPINSEAWLWYYKVVGGEKCSVVDTFWQTETGGHVLTPLPGATPMKPGSATFPFFGVQPALLDESGKEIEGEGEGYLVFKRPWPGIMRSLFGNHERYEATYFSKFPGYYCTGDGARRDADGYFWITGRIDDMLNVSGHLMSTAEVESLLTEHKAIAEAAVVSKPHPIKGECLYCFVITSNETHFDDNIKKELSLLIRERIGAFATPDVIHNTPSLPKTRSGKIMRRILRKVAVNDRNLGDVSTLADSTVIETLFASRPVCS
ncbi:acetyl-coenzyme A synthetase [Agrilus planipennis]|uniref:Acetyl-coenzyme A synthetase n=1 Tax=Agrilus planipennis TaxID=224129 RepID=A0A1W4WPW3_AGRPL|nr:acetyl-coenzyme A synthetase [Agrilus planipennis]